MSIRLQKKAPRPAGFFIRTNPNDPERGPLSIENLRDLAEFQHLQPDSLIRPENEDSARPLREFLEIFQIVFPEQKRFSFKRPAIAAEPADDLPPIDVTSLLRCETGDPISIERTERKKPAPPPSASPNEIQQILAEDNALLKAKIPPQEVEQPRFLASRVFSLLRWFLVAFLFYTLILVWRDFADSPSWGVLLSMPILVFIGALTAIPFLDWLLDSFSARLTRIPPPDIDYTEAEELFRAERWKEATNAYAKIVKEDPRQIRAYREGIAAAVAAGDEKKAALFRDAAAKSLSLHDHNLLEGALRRHGLLPLPETDPPNDE